MEPAESETVLDLDGDKAQENSRRTISKRLNELNKVVQSLVERVQELEARYDVASIETMVKPFTGDDDYGVKKWLADLECAFILLKLGKEKKLNAARHLLRGTAELFLRTVHVFDFEDLKEDLLKEFGSSVVTCAAHLELKKRTRQPGETIQKYVLEMTELSLKAKVPEELLVDYIIMGLGEDNLDMLYNASTLGELKKLLNRWFLRYKCENIVSEKYGS
ncbi:Dwil\GK24604-PA-like protein [Anopheles sinensis]|uniref:Dwil\GK24604-PA-like protein n=1 Tax=Anopheles sinensis TaxID=74873 RepID=A0A084VZ61_ANOSI|nr:Dwil\GK24604-PA-like protein [Anopheles sinensis]